MSISINPIIPVIAAQGIAPDLVLQPGSVVEAEVLKLLSDNLVRIAIASLSIDVLSEVPLAVGQTLQLAVSQTESGLKLAVVGRQSATPAAAPSASSDVETPVPAAVVDVADVATTPRVNAAPPKIELTPLERIAVSAAVQGAAAQQQSLAPLFANLAAAAASNSLPAKLQQAVTQVLAQRTNLDPALTANDIKTAFQKSGLFLEASLASGSALPPAGVPDLKAALIVLRQTLASAVGLSATTESAAAPLAVVPQVVAPPVVGTPATDAAASPHPDGTPPLHAVAAPPPHPDAELPLHRASAATVSPPLVPEIDVREILLPQARIPVAAETVESGGTVRIIVPETLLNAAPHTMTAGAALNLLQEGMQESPDIVGSASAPAAMLKAGSSDDVVFHTNTPPPPFRGALPSAQPIVSASIVSNAPLATTAHHLLGEADAAIARQTLLQVASLPDRVDISGARIDPAAPRWSFEIPFATLQGTAVAQFEIARDGGGSQVQSAKRIWRARFSIDIEPAGPVHALISLSERTSVRLWAERPATAAQLRAGAGQLSQALSEAELQPGDIVIRAGTPPQPAPAPAGHFLDRAL
jgi:hypothetical protein